MKKLFLATLLITFSLVVISQDKKALKYAKTITQKDLRSHLTILSSDSLQGRETGEKGQKMAANYLRNVFVALGLQPPVSTDSGNSYFQTYGLMKKETRTVYLKKDEETRENFEDFLFYSRAETMGEEFIDIVYGGKGEMEALKKLDLKGKYIAILNEEMAGWRNLMSGLEELGAAGVFMIIEDDDRFGFIMERMSPYLSKPKISLEDVESESKILIGDPKLAEWIYDTSFKDLKNDGFGRSARLIFNADMLIYDITGENVLGYLEGEKKSDELLIITAHYDHIGITEDGEINNGADDDGSGVSTVLEIAEAFTKAAEKGLRPRRSVLFMLVSGEEKGLLGSQYYVEHPVFELDNTVADLNVDMVGRVDEAHNDNPDYVYVIGSDKLSQDLHTLSEQINETYVNLDFDYTYNDENDPNRYYYRSDHYNFAKHGIPIIFYFNGTHPDYHRPTDTIEKINFDVMEKRAKLIFHTAWEVANREEAIKRDSESK